MLLSVFTMVRVGRRPCPNFPRHCFYILTNPQILKEWPQMRRPRLTRTTWFMKILMAWESTVNVEPAQIKNNVLNVPPNLTKCPTCTGPGTRSDKDQITIKLPWPQSSTQLTLIHVWFREWDWTKNEIETEIKIE